MRIPRIVIAGTGSGVGKTTISTSLARAFTRIGLKVQTFKTGPDYLDPTYLAMASGRPCYNLDGWMMGTKYVKEMFIEKSRDADISIIEGVMGFYDGASPDSSEGSTAEIARLLDAPVILAIDASGVARSAAAIVKGYAELESGLSVAGVIANSCGSAGHEKWMRDALEAESLPPLVGAMAKGAFDKLKSRHLGLFSATCSDITNDAMNAMADTIESCVDIEAVKQIADNANDIEAPTREETTIVADKFLRIGIAMDEAFHFYYRDNLDLLENLGCELVEFSPATDETLPEDLNALYFGGGYPEELAEKLSANKSMIESVREFAESGAPVYAECGGLIYLAKDVTAKNGTVFEMAGILPFGVKMLDRIKRLGYVEVELMKDSLWGKKGTVSRGHEFHYSELVDEKAEEHGWEKVYSMMHRRSDSPVIEGFMKGNILASYAHLHLASRPHLLRCFVLICTLMGKK